MKVDATQLVRANFNKGFRMDNNENTNTLILEITSEVVSSYVSNNPISPTDLPGFIREVHSTLAAVSGSGIAPAAEPQKPAVSIRKSLGHDYLICLEDGQKFKSLKRHLKSHYDLSPDEYRKKWGLPSDYPMVAPAYAERRSALAKEMGLGQKRKRAK